MDVKFIGEVIFMKTGLLLIDLQLDYFPGGRMALDGAKDAVFAAARLLAAFREAEWPVCHIQHISSRAGATFFLPGTSGIDIHPAVKPNENEPIIEKHFPNSFRETELMKHLRSNQIERLVICGMMTNMCIDATVRAAYDQGFDCMVAHDACAARSLEFSGRGVQAGDVHAAFLAALQGIYARVLSVDEICSMLP